MEKKLKNVFRKAFETDEEIEKMEYGQSKNWDSIGHLRLVSSVEEEFSIHLSGEDVWKMNSYNSTLGIIKDKLQQEA